MQKAQLKLIKGIIKENRKKFLGNLWRNYADVFLFTADDMIGKFLWDKFDDKNFARKLKVVYLAAEKDVLGNWWNYCTDRHEIIYVVEKLYDKYWERFENLYGNRAKERGGWPHPKNRTQIIKESLAMGFIYRDDLDYDPEKEYCVYLHIGGLYWPKLFENHQDAISIQIAYGINGYTGTKIPKK